MTTYVTFWAGAPLSYLEQLCLQSFLERGHAVELYAYGPPEGTPKGVEVCDAAKFLPLDGVVRTMMAKRAYARVSDLLRYRLLAEPDRTWVDVDVFLLADDLPVSPMLFGREDEHYIANGVLRLPPDSELLRRLVEATATIPPVTATAGDHGTYGPMLLTRLADELGLRGVAVDPGVLYPVVSRDVWRLFDPRERGWVDRQLAHASAFHLWNEFLRRGGLRERRPPRGSWLDRETRRRGIEPPQTSVRVAWVRGPWRQQLPDPPTVRPPITIRSVIRRAVRSLRRRLGRR